MKYERRPVAINGWEMYECDTDGNVYSKSGKILKYSISHNGYCIVNFYNNHVRKGFAVHTVIATTFIEKNSNKTQVNHKNGIKTDNSVDNLEWVTALENARHAIYVLGFDNNGAKNHNAKTVYGYDKKTNELVYEFDCVMNAAKFFAGDDMIRARNIQKIISQVAGKYGTKKSYAKCIWRYDKI